ncbi:endoglucanase precursor [Anaerotignum neopropionicum]|uniref:Endoglucanase n=2 Tax=Anaerotignum neopropionicum TaxID=36847 RepID=A0A136WF67_9FIRM|nr:endoglucanase precursor [Anaerotignum neopropionicum]
MMLMLLPVMAFAANPSVNIGNTPLTDGKYYIAIDGDDPASALVKEVDEQPSDDTPYLYFSGGVLTVSGDVSLNSTGPCPLMIRDDKLIIAGSGSLILTCGGAPVVDISGASLSLSESVNFSADQTASAPAMNGGTVETEDGYSGNITISSSGNSAFLGMNTVNLQTTGDILISGSGSSPVISSGGAAVTLKGRSVSVTHDTRGMLIHSSSISVTATGEELSFTGDAIGPLLSADNGITLSADGNITVTNTYIAVSGDLTVTQADDVFVSSESSYAVSGLTVLTAQNVTVTSNGEAPTIFGGANITATGDIAIQNNGNNRAIDSSSDVSDVSIVTTVGSITVTGKGSAPAIETLGAVTLAAKNNIVVTGECETPIAAESQTLTSESGVIQLTGSTGTSTSITLANGSTILVSEGHDVSAGLDLSTLTPTANTYYPAGNGYALWMDVTYDDVDETYTGTLVLRNATIENTTALVGGTVGAENTGIALPQGNVTLQVEGENNISSAYDLGIWMRNGSITLTDGANVTVHGSISINTGGGANGTINVMGRGTTLNASAPSGYAIDCETLNVEDGASLNVNAHDEDSMGILANGNVNLTGGATLSAGCDYGVYIIDGTLMVDKNSKLITNGAVAPFCVVDTTSTQSQSNVIGLPGLPKGTEIMSVVGDSLGYTYWSLVPTNGSLSVDDENNTPAILTGAIKGLLTFKKASSNSGSSGGGVSLTRTLTFKTNGGSEISSVSKTSGDTVDLSSYKPTREGYAFAGWYSDEALTNKISSVTLTTSTTVYAKWTELTEKTEETKETKNPFTDVKDSDYFYDAVQWAVENEITSGTTNTTFGPSMICTRGQMVAFLWRAMGSPEPTTANCPFTDVSKDAYYYKAVLWAVEKGITAGTTATTFSPNATVTRGQTVTFLWRGAGKPAASGANPYTDVSKGDYNYEAVLWAAEKGITQGTSAATFSPDAPCTRAQIVTFLFRNMEK